MARVFTHTIRLRKKAISDLAYICIGNIRERQGSINYAAQVCFDSTNEPTQYLPYVTSSSISHIFIARSRTRHRIVVGNCIKSKRN